MAGGKNSLTSFLRMLDPESIDSWTHTTFYLTFSESFNFSTRGDFPFIFIQISWDRVTSAADSPWRNIKHFCLIKQIIKSFWLGFTIVVCEKMYFEA